MEDVKQYKNDRFKIVIRLLFRFITAVLILSMIACTTAYKVLDTFIKEKKKYVQLEIEKRFGIKDYDVKFDLVAHSMGGLVARYYLRYPVTAPYCAAVRLLMGARPTTSTAG